LQGILNEKVITQGMRLPILRETRMPAVWCRLGPASLVVERAGAVTDALREAVTTWCTATADTDSSSTD
jgi:N-acetylmuramoyl-L-alanine amidase